MPQRESTNKQLRRRSLGGPPDWSVLDRAFKRFESESVVALLMAACDSPGCGHRLPSLAVSWMRAVAAPPRGNHRATIADLPTLLGAARRAVPKVRDLEDCWSVDPRLCVRFAVRSARKRIHPGAFTDPLGFLSRIRMTALAIDPFLNERYDFALTDLMEVALAYMDWRLQLLRPAWEALAPMPFEAREPEDEPLNVRIRRIAAAPVSLSAEEVAATTEALSAPTTAWVSTCSNPQRAASAWTWATGSASRVTPNLKPGCHLLGPVLALQSPIGTVPVPAALVLDGLAVAAARVSAEAALDPMCQERLRQETGRRAMTLLAPAIDMQDEAMAPSQLTPALASARPPANVVVVLDHRHVCAIELVSALDRATLLFELNRSEKELQKITIAELQRYGLAIDDNALLRHATIAGGLLDVVPQAKPGGLVLHVEDLAMVLHDAASAEEGRDLLWQFLDEVESSPGVRKLQVLEFYDLWRHWMKFGVLNPTGLTGIGVHVDPSPDMKRWREASKWEPIASVLAGALLPERTEWPSATLDAPGRATLVDPIGDVWQVLAHPPIAICASTEAALADLGVDPAFLCEIGIGVRQTFIRYPDVAAAIVDPTGTPLLLRIRLVADHITAQGDAGPSLRFAVAAAPTARIDIAVGLDWLEELAADGPRAHSLLGQVLDAALQHLSEVTGRPRGKPGDLHRAWACAAPVAGLHAQQTPLPQRHRRGSTVPRTRATRAKAERALATAVLRQAGVPGTWTGQEAIEKCADVIVPAAEDALRQTLSTWGPAAVHTVANHLNDAHAARARGEMELSLALGAPWAAAWRDFALRAPAAARGTRPLEVLLEFLLADCPTGTITPDRFDVAEATDLAERVLEVGLCLSGARRGLHELIVAISEGGNIAIAAPASLGDLSGTADEAAWSGVDLDAYQRADRLARLRLLAAGDEPQRGEPQRPRVTFPPGRSPATFVSLRDDCAVPGTLLRADAILQQECGFGIDAISAVLGTAMTWTADNDPVVYVARQAVKEAAAQWSSVPDAEISAALDRLTLDPEELGREGLRYWEQERRSHRIAVRPLVRHADNLLLIPWRTRSTQAVLSGYLLSGRLPWPSRDIPQKVQDAFNEFRQTVNRTLEREAAAVPVALQLPCRRNIQAHEAIAAGVQVPGEVDLLIADPAQRRFWVCEVKDVSMGFSPDTISVRVDEFLRRDGYVDRLIQRADAIRAHTAAGLALLGVAVGSLPWRVLPLMITRHIEPAAFTASPLVPFVVVTDLREVLGDSEDPGPGYGYLSHEP